jgi:2-dehydro-3-deoxyphosphogluconate aldolase/(4S)-4-hydroxy-2-oxoglutarate aldolase
MGYLDTLERIREVGIIPAIRTSDPHLAVRAAQAIRDGGVPVIEVSLALPKALDVLDAMATLLSRSVIVGAGSVVDAEGVRQAALSGAQFIVTPGYIADTVDKAKEFGLPIFAGAMTPTEIQSAFLHKVDAVKLFPCYANWDIRYFRAMRGQYPHVDFIVSGGIGLANCEEFIRAGASAIGVGGEIADNETLAAGAFRIFTVRAKRLRKAVHDARGIIEDDSSLNVGEGR